MQVLCSDYARSTQTSIEIKGTSFRVGRSPTCEVVLNSPTISDVVLAVRKTVEGWEITACGMNDVEVAGTPLEYETPFLLRASAVIKIDPGYDLVLDIPKEIGIGRAEKIESLNSGLSAFVKTLHLEVLDRMKLANQGRVEEKPDDDRLRDVETSIEDIARKQGVFAAENRHLVDYMTGLCVMDALMQKMSLIQSGASNSVLQSGRHYGRFLTVSPQLERELTGAVESLERKLGILKDETLETKLETIEHKFWDVWEEVLKRHHLTDNFRNYLVLRYLKKNLKDVLFGYGPLEDLLRIPLITEIMVVNSETIFVEKSGRIENSGRRFFSESVTQTIISRIVSRVNRHIDKSQPLVDARLSDGSRVNAIIDPISISGSCLTIRRFPETRLKVEDLVRIGSISRPAAEFLKASILARKNILVSGGTGTGKTTLLNCICDFIPSDERIVTIEDTAELQINKKHVVRLETKEANTEGRGAYTIRDLVKNSLRMRPDRIIVGECRGPEALDMLQAMNTGHDGSLTTIHANTSMDAVKRLEVLVLTAANLPITAIHEQIVSAIDLIVQLRRMRNGRRCITQISEVSDIDPVTHQIRLRDIFLLENDIDDNATLSPTGSLPSFLGMLISRNMINLDNFFINV